MQKAVWLAGCALAGLATPAIGQTPSAQMPIPSAAAPAPVPTQLVAGAPEVDAAQHGVLIFEPAFFADARPDTALDMIARLPGFGLDIGDSGTRGLAGTAGNVLIDGVGPSTKSDSLDQILRRISAAGVARIELIRGGAPGIDMQGRSVVANVILVRTVVTERVMEATAFFYPDGYIGPSLSGRYARREGDNQIEVSLKALSDQTDGTGGGFRRRYDSAGNLIQDVDLVRWSRIRDVQATGAVQRGVAEGLLKVNGLLNWYDSASSREFLIRSGAGADSFNEEGAVGTTGEIGANWIRNWSSRTGLEVTGLQRYGRETYTGVSTGSAGASTFDAEQAAGESIARATVRYRPNDQYAVETGGEIAFNFLDSANAYEENGVVIPLPSASVRVEELRGEVFGQTTWRPNPEFTLEAGVRVEISEISQSGDSNLSKSFVFPKPRVQMTWTPWAGHQFRFRAEREVGQLDFGDFVASADIAVGRVEGGNPDLEPQTSTVFEVVYERRFWNDGVLDLTWTHASVQNVIDFIPLTGGFDAVGNIGDGKSDVFQAGLTLPMDRFGVPNGRLQLSGKWTKTAVVDPVTGERRAFHSTPAFDCGVKFNQDLRGGRWSYGFEHRCNEDRYTTFRGREIFTYYVEPGVSAYVQWKPRADLTVRADFGNITDRRFGYEREVYTGPRHTASLDFRELRRTQTSPWLSVQVRKAF